MLRLAPILLLFLAGCSGARTASQTYAVDSTGTVSTGIRSAADAEPGVTGAQELFGAAIPVGPFTAKAALVWDGQPSFWTPPAPAPAVQVAYPSSACDTTATETVMERQVIEVPVQRTRVIRRVAVPVPLA